MILIVGVSAWSGLKPPFLVRVPWWFCSAGMGVFGRIWYYAFIILPPDMTLSVENSTSSAITTKVLTTKNKYSPSIGTIFQKLSLFRNFPFGIVNWPIAWWIKKPSSLPSVYLSIQSVRSVKTWSPKKRVSYLVLKSEWHINECFSVAEQFFGILQIFQL